MSLFNRIADKGRETESKPSKLDNFKKYGGPDKNSSGQSAPFPGSDFSILYSKDRKANGFSSYIHWCNGQSGKENLTGNQSPFSIPPSKKCPKEQEPGWEEIEHTAFQKGFSEGEKKGYEAGKEKFDEIITSMQHILEEIKGLRENMVAAYEKEVIRLISRVSEKVVYGHVAVDHEVVKRSILHAFELIPEPVEVTIAVSPKDYEYIEEIKREFFETVEGLKQVSIISDPTIARGGCKIETRSGEVDARLESRLNAIQQSLIDTCEKNRSR
jgi:flagellar biosynthesis/type III secretory pathway protein FliH